MGRLTEDMTNLRDEIGALRNERVEFIAGLKHGMSELKSDMVDMQQGFRKDHTRMAGNMKDNLKAFLTETEAYVSNLKNDVADMRTNFGNDHTDMADTQKKNLQIFVSGIKATVSDLEKQFRKEHDDVTGKARTERDLFFSNVKQSLADLKHQTTNFLQDIGDDLAGARRAWSGAIRTPVGKKSGAKVGRPAKVQAAQEMIVPPTEFHAKPEKVEPRTKDQTAQKRTTDAVFVIGKDDDVQAESDDLTQINGIGPGMSRRLNDAGIFTYAKLSSSKIEDLRNALGESARLANLERWIKQSRELSS